MNRFVRVALLLCVVLLLFSEQAAARPVPDSLGVLWQWPLPVQLRLAARRIDAPLVPQAEAVSRNPRLSGQVRSRLLFQLGKFYFFDIQPSLALMRFLECRKLVQHDTQMRCEVEIELSYAYQWLRQPRTGLTHGREALRLAKPLNDARLLNKAYGMMAICADQLPNKRLALYYYQRSLYYARQRRTGLSTAIGQIEVAQAYYNLQQYAEAARWLDSTRYSLRKVQISQQGTLLYNDQFMNVGVRRLAADLARQRGQHAEAVQLLIPVLPGIRQADDRFLEIDVLKALVPALQALKRYQEALGHQQRLSELQSVMFEESSARHARELQTLYETQQKEQQLARQRQRIASLQARTRLREAELTRRTTLFLAALAGAGLMLVLVVVRQRAKHLLESTAAALRMRNRIAADLHDEVGTLLTRVNLQAELLRQSQPDPALDRLLTNSRAAASTMRDIVWSIDAQADTVGALLDRMRDHLDQTAAAAGLETELTTHGLPDQEALSPELRQHLYLVFKEAVTNAVRHAHHATRLRVALTRQQGQLLLSVEDDGRNGGSTARSGMGLRNMQQRAAALRGSLLAAPHENGGFGVHLTVPA